MIVRMTDASLLGWGLGNTLDTHMAQGKWMSQKTMLHFNLLELRAVRYVCLQFLLLIWGSHIKVIMDMSCMFYINR